MSTININISKVDLGLDQVDNTSDLNKPISTATQTALDTKVDKVDGSRLITSSESTLLGNTSGTNTGDQNLSGLAPLASPTFTGTVVLPTATSIGTVSSTELGYLDGVASSIQNQLNAKVNLNTLITEGSGLRIFYDAKGLILSSENCNVQTVTSSATVTAVSTNDLVDITAQATGLTLANPTGTFYNGQIISFRIKDNATAQTIAFGSKFKGYGRALPTTTTISKYIEISAMYNSVADTFSVVYIVEL